jgi:hypothetical protein
MASVNMSSPTSESNQQSECQQVVSNSSLHFQGQSNRIIQQEGLRIMVRWNNMYKLTSQ